MTINEKKTSLCLVLCLILWQNSTNTWFGHFSVENLNTRIIFLLLCMNWVQRWLSKMMECQVNDQVLNDWGPSVTKLKFWNHAQLPSLLFRSAGSSKICLGQKETTENKILNCTILSFRIWLVELILPVTWCYPMLATWSNIYYLILVTCYQILFTKYLLPDTW